MSFTKYILFYWHKILKRKPWISYMSQYQQTDNSILSEEYVQIANDSLNHQFFHYSKQYVTYESSIVKRTTIDWGSRNIKLTAKLNPHWQILIVSATWLFFMPKSKKTQKKKRIIIENIFKNWNSPTRIQIP